MELRVLSDIDRVRKLGLTELEALYQGVMDERARLKAIQRAILPILEAKRREADEAARRTRGPVPPPQTIGG